MRFTEFEIEFKEKLGEIFLLVKCDDIARSNRNGYIILKQDRIKCFVFLNVNDIEYATL